MSVKRCYECNGSGEVIDESDLYPKECPSCSGRGYTEEDDGTGVLSTIRCFLAMYPYTKIRG